MFSVKFYRPNRVRVIITQILIVFEESQGEIAGSDELGQGFLTNHANLPILFSVDFAPGNSGENNGDL